MIVIAATANVVHQTHHNLLISATPNSTIYTLTVSRVVNGLVTQIGKRIAKISGGRFLLLQALTALPYFVVVYEFFSMRIKVCGHANTYRLMFRLTK
jgi:hypothetical protein